MKHLKTVNLIKLFECNPFDKILAEKNLTIKK